MPLASPTEPARRLLTLVRSTDFFSMLENFSGQVYNGVRQTVFPSFAGPGALSPGPFFARRRSAVTERCVFFPVFF